MNAKTMNKIPKQSIDSIKRSFRNTFIVNVFFHVSVSWCCITSNIYVSVRSDFYHYLAIFSNKVDLLIIVFDV